MRCSGHQCYDSDPEDRPGVAAESQQESLWDSQHLVRLETEPPLGMREAVAHSQRRVARALGPVHRLEEEVAEVEPDIALGLGAPLREYELELVAASHHELGAGLGADADPVDPRRDQTSAVRLDGHFEAPAVHPDDERLVELEQRLAA